MTNEKKMSNWKEMTKKKSEDRLYTKKCHKQSKNIQPTLHPYKILQQYGSILS